MPEITLTSALIVVTGGFHAKDLDISTFFFGYELQVQTVGALGFPLADVSSSQCIDFG